MGAETSSENNVIISHLSTLLSEDHSGNYQFWYNFLQESPDRFSSLTPEGNSIQLDPRIVYELAIRQSNNFENYILTSLKELSEASKSIYGTVQINPDEETPPNFYDLTDEKHLNAIHFALTTLPTFLATLLRGNQCLSSLAFLDSELFEEIAKNLPSAAEFEKRKKKLNKVVKSAETTKNPEEEEVEEKPTPKEQTPTESTKPKKKKTLSPEKALAKKIRIRYFAMRRQRGSVFSDLARYLSILLFKPELTVLGNKNKNTSLHSWSYVSLNVDQIRYDIVHNLLFLGSIFDTIKLYKIEKPISSFISVFHDGSFPIHQLILSLGNINTMPNHSLSPRLIHNTLALIIMLFNYKGCKQLFSDIELTAYTRIFFNEQKGKKSNIRLEHFAINQTDKFSAEWISFLFISLSSKPELLELVASNEEVSKEVIKFLLDVADARFKQEGISYLHSIILTTLLFLLETDENHPPPMLRKVTKVDQTKSINNQNSTTNQQKVDDNTKQENETEQKVDDNTKQENETEQKVDDKTKQENETEQKVDDNTKQENETEQKVDDNAKQENDQIETENIPNENEVNENAKQDNENYQKDSQNETPKQENVPKQSAKQLKAKPQLEFKKKFVLNYLDDPITPGDIKDSCFADFILTTLMNFCTSRDFLPSFCCVFHLIAPHVQDVTLDTAIRLIQLYEKCPVNVQNLFIDAFATLVQMPRLHSSIKTMLFHKWDLFMDDEDHPDKEEQLGIIRAFIKKAKKALIKYGPSTRLGIEAAADVISNMNIQIKKTFPNPKYFLKHPITTGTEIERTWRNWSRLICQIAAMSEVKAIKTIGQTQ